MEEIEGVQKGLARNIHRNIIRCTFIFTMHVGRIFFSRMNNVIKLQCVLDNFLTIFWFWCMDSRGQMTYKPIFEIKTNIF